MRLARDRARLLAAPLAALALLNINSCGDEGSAPVEAPPPGPPLLAQHVFLDGPGVPVFEKLQVCKYWTDGTTGVATDFDVFVEDINSGTSSTMTRSLNADECKEVAQFDGMGPGNVSITEIVPAGAVLDQLIVTVVDQSGTVIFSDVITDSPTFSWDNADNQVGILVEYYNRMETPSGGDGFMTGGGSVFTVDGCRVTRGFEIHCDTSHPNNLQVNWKGGNKFHMLDLMTASCTDDPNIHQAPPAADFDTFVGHGTGRLNGVDGATIDFTFVDAGEPGTSDHASIQIRDSGGTLVLDVAGFLRHGNLQAH